MKVESEKLSAGKNVPKLRFGGFEGQWFSHCINDVSECVTSGSRDWAKYYSDKGDKFIRMTNLGREGINLFLEDMKYVSIPKGGSEGQRTSLQENDILISITAELGKIGIIPEDFGTAYINQHTALVRVNHFVNAKFLAQNLVTNKSNRKLNRLNDSGAKSGLNLSTIRNFEFTAPPTLPEQQKIASFLSKVDEKIALLGEKKAKLVEYKKRVMQGLFSGEWKVESGKLTFVPPTLRFKADDGSDFPDWEEKKLEEITKPVKRKASETVSKVMTISASQGFLDQKERFSQIIAGSSLDRYTHIKKGEFSYNRGNSKIFKYGCIYLMREDEALVPFVYRTFKLISGIPEFYQQLFLNHVLDRQLRKMISSSARMDGLLNIGEKDFYKVKLFVPSLKEQTKIANFLSAIDKKIELTNTELEKAKEWKKGLLQQMFV